MEKYKTNFKIKENPKILLFVKRQIIEVSRRWNLSEVRYFSLTRQEGEHCELKAWKSIWALYTCSWFPWKAADKYIYGEKQLSASGAK